MNGRLYVLPLLVASGVVAWIAAHAPVARVDRLLLLALLGAAYGLALLGIQLTVAVLRRLRGRRGPSSGALECFVFLGALLANQLLTLFGHKSLATYERLSAWTTLHPAFEAVVLVLALALLGAAGRWVVARLGRGPSLSRRGAAILAALAIAAPLLPGAPAPRAVIHAEAPTPEQRVLAPLPRGPLVVVGLDGIDPRLLEAAVRARSMPNFQALLEQGLVSSLDNDGLGLSPVVWTTLITGRPPNEHRLTDFRVREAAGFSGSLDRWLGVVPPGFAVKSIVLRGLSAAGRLQARNLTGRDRSGPSVFQILSRYGRRSLVVNYMMSFPAEKIDGAFLSEYVYDARLAAARSGKPLAPGYVYPSGLLEGALAGIEARPAASRDVLERDERAFDYTSGVALALLERERFDLIVFYTPWPDAFNHRLSYDEYRGILGGRFDAGLPQRLLETYARLDRFLGDVRARLPQADLVVVSDHGVRPIYRVRKPLSGAEMRISEEPGDAPAHLSVVADLEHLHSDRGLFLGLGPTIAAGPHAPISMYDLAPTLLAYLGAPVPRDLRGHVVAGLVPRPVQHAWIESYEPWIGNERVDPDARLVDDAAERLRALGYIE